MSCEAGTPASLSSAAGWTVPTYALFRRKQGPDLCFAVHEGCPIPSRIDREVWAYAGTVTGNETALLGFDEADARHGIELNGYYLFFWVPRRTAAAV